MKNTWTRAGMEEFRRELAEEGIFLPFAEDFRSLKAPLPLKNVTIPNRIAIQPMEGCDSGGDGTPGELTRRRYDRFARGGAGLLWMEANAVVPEGRANPHQMMLTEKNLDSFRRLLEDIREAGMKENGYAPALFLQMTHSGRYSKPEGKAAPLILYHCETLKSQEAGARILTDAELDALPEKYERTADLARRAGFDGVDVKCCHRYLLSEALSAYTREGKYGGDYAGRTRLLKSCFGAAKAGAGRMCVTSRLNIYDGYAWPDGWGISREGGTEPEMTEPIRLVRELGEMGAEILDITLGNPYFNPHVNRPFSQGSYTPPEDPFRGVERACRLTAEIRKAVPGVKLIASALSYARQFAPHIGAGLLEAGGADMAGFGRLGFAYPEMAKDLLSGREADPKKVCIACSKCTELMRAGSTPGCVIRDPVYAGLYRDLKKAEEKGE